MLSSPPGTGATRMGNAPNVPVLEVPTSSADRPPSTAARSPRVFGLRIYEGATDQDHERKVEMMRSGEAEILNKAGVAQVFYSDTLIGPRLQNLTYILAFDNLADRDKKWAVFRGSDEWKSDSTQPPYEFEAIVSNINNYNMTPTAYSQI